MTSGLLGLDLLRRDEIWFIEKDRKSCLQRYSLEEFVLPYDNRYPKGYLSGRTIGAIPILSSLHEPGMGRKHGSRTVLHPVQRTPRDCSKEIRIVIATEGNKTERDYFKSTCIANMTDTAMFKLASQRELANPDPSSVLNDLSRAARRIRKQTAIQ